MSLDDKKVVLLVLLDLSAAFDTVNHQILLDRLKYLLGIDGLALNWIISYLSHRVQKVVIDDDMSDILNILFGVPQGSVLGPLLFIIYTSPLGSIIEKHGVSYHLYADDTQLYISIDLSDTSQSRIKMEKCIFDIQEWMSNNFLCLNGDKTEVLLLTPKSKDVPNINIHIDSDTIGNTQVVKNLGAYFDSHLCMRDQITNACRLAWYQLRKISKIRSYLDRTAAEKLIHAFVTSRLDLNNGLLYGVPEYEIKRLSRVQYAAARILTRCAPHTHNIM